MKSLAIIDIDGTIIDFWKIDHDIIAQMYGKNKIISILDKFLWKVNSLDIITNRFILFKIRLWLYSLLNRSRYNYDMELYKTKYIEMARCDFDCFMNKEYASLKESQISVRLLTCDPFDGFFDERVTTVQSKKRYVLDNIYGKYDKVYIFGNNYMDDIKVGIDLRARMDDKNKVQVFYIGNSSLMKKLIKNKDVHVYFDLSQAIKKIC